MLPDGITIEQAAAKACRIARRVAPRGMHVDEADSAAGLALVVCVRDYKHMTPALFWKLVRLRASRDMWRVYFRAKVSGVRGVPSGARRTGLDSIPEPFLSPDLDAGMDAETLLARFQPTEREMLRAIADGRTMEDIGAGMGLTGNAVRCRLRVARKVALAS